jgi:hypothetical protein
MNTFNVKDIVVAKKEFLADYETEADTLGVVIDYNPSNDLLILGVLNPQDYGIAPTFSMRGEYYRTVSADELKAFGIE